MAMHTAISDHCGGRRRELHAAAAAATPAATHVQPGLGELLEVGRDARERAAQFVAVLVVARHCGGSGSSSRGSEAGGALGFSESPARHTAAAPQMNMRILRPALVGRSCSGSGSATQRLRQLPPLHCCEEDAPHLLREVDGAYVDERRVVKAAELGALLLVREGRLLERLADEPARAWGRGGGRDRSSRRCCSS